MKQFSLLKHTVTVFFKKRFLGSVLLVLFSFLSAKSQTNPTVTIDQAAAQNDPTFLSPINFSVVFNQPVIGFTTGDIVLTGTAGATIAVVTGGPSIFNVAVTGMTSCGTIIATIPAGVCINSLTQPNLASTSTDNTVTLLLTNPNVTINQAATQADPTNSAPINFTVQFDQLVSGFATGDVTLSGTAGATNAVVTGSGDRYNVAVSGMTSAGTVIASIAANVCTNYCGVPNNASASTDNTVTINCVTPVVNVTPNISCGGVVGAGCLSPLTASGNANTYTWLPLTGLFIDCTATIPYIGDSRTVVYAAPTVNTTYTVKGTITATGCSSTATALVNYTTAAPVVVPSFVNMCLGDPAVKLKVFPGSLPASPAFWSPIAGLYLDAAATTPYTGTQTDSLWARPTPNGTYNYLVTTQSAAVPICTASTNFVANNGDGTITFNIKNNHPFPIRLLQIDSKTITAAQTLVAGYYKTSAINGPPGTISAANGWNLFASSSIAATGAIQPFLTNQHLVIPAGVTYGICLQANTFASVPNLAISSLSAGTHNFNSGGCELITGTNIGYSGNGNTPATALSGFIGSVQFTDATVSCTSPARSVTVNVGTGASITSQPANQNICPGNPAIFTVGVSGAGPFTYQWQLSVNGVNGPYSNLVIGSPAYLGVNTNTLTIPNPTLGMSGYAFKLIIGSCSSLASDAALLTVNPQPTVSITANPVIIGPTQSTTITSTVTPNPATSYAWYYNTALLTGQTSPSLVVNYGSPGDYQLKVTDANNCGVGVSNIITIANNFAFFKYIYPNPSGGIVQVRHPLEPNRPAQRTLNVFNNQGNLLFSKTVMQTVPYQAFDVDLRAYGPGMYWLEWKVANGGRLAMSKVVVR